MKSKPLPVNIPAIEFVRRLSSCKKIAATRIFLLLVYFIKLLVVMPVAFLQFVFYNRRINKTVVTKSPIFIIGHYRSGTGYLHKLMCADAGFGFIKTYDIICPNSGLLFGRWLQKCIQFIINTFHIKTSFYNNRIANLDDPAEEERFLINKGSAFTDYWRFVFPLCWNKWKTCAALSENENYYRRWKKEYLYLLKMITLKNNGKQLVLKSPPNTERIKYLLEIFPNAKFIYISRNPYPVFYSTYNMWQKAISKFRLQNISQQQVEEIIFSEYPRLIEEYKKQKVFIPKDNLIEILYEDIEAYTLNVLEDIYTQLHLPGFKMACENFTKKIQQESHYQTFEYMYSQQVFNKIDSRWDVYIEQWNGKNSGGFISDYIYSNKK